MEYKCTKCGSVLTERMDICPQCGEKLYYCKHKGCGKQLFDANIKYCAFHQTERNEKKKTAGKIALTAVALVASVPLIILTKGKFNPIKK